MRKRILSVILTLCLLCALLPAAALPASAERSDTDIAYPVEGGSIYFDKATGTITACDEFVTKADIPSKIDGVEVTGIGDSAFSGCDSLTSVTIPDSVTSIGDQAFYQCSSLTSVTIGSSVTSIGDEAFAFCGLTSVTIPDSVTRIGNWAFSYCDSLTSVTIPDSVTSIGEHAFFNCNSLTSVTIGSSVTSIGDEAFNGCSSLTAIHVAEGNTEYSSVDGVLFNKETSSLITYPASKTETEYSIPEGVTSIGDYAFSECISLTSVTIPDSVTSIGEYAFFDCYSLTSMTIPSSVTSIGEYAFFECSSLTSVTIPNSLTSIGDRVFYGCYSLTSVTIPDSVTSIGESAFSGCNSLTTVTIPDSVTSIGHGAFDGFSLTAIDVAAGNTEYSSVDGILFNKDQSTLLVYPAGKTETEYRIPNSVTSIGESAFSGCDSLTSVTIPNSVTSIGEYAFSGCSSLTSVTIPESVTSIGDYAFSSCSSLTSVTIPNSVTSVGYSAFSYCNSLTSVTIPNGVTSIGDFAFEGCSSLTSVTIGNSVTSIGAGAFLWCSSLTSVTIPNSVTSIGDNAFYNCTSLTSVYFEGNAPEIGESVFQMLNGETWEYVNIPNLTLYYIEGKDGWTSPTWNGYPTATWDGLNVPGPYADVSKTAWYYDAVQYATNNGLMNGVGDNEFDPEGSMTRAMLVTVLWRYEGSPTGYDNPFTDVNATDGSWYIDAVAWAAKNEIVGGVGDNKFDPDGNVTREQMATILFRYANKTGIDTGKRGELGSFPDAGKISSYAKDAIAWTVAEGVINGSDGRLLPQGDATRSQVSAILMRFIENIVKK